MPTFGIIAEGHTDQIIIENILCGVFDAVYVNPVQPPVRVVRSIPSGGWTLVFRSLRSDAHRQALAFNDYVILQIDTDRCTDQGFDVENDCSPEVLVERVRERLKAEMPDFVAIADRIVFAVAVHETECWLLPLIRTDKNVKITGCFKAARQALKKANKDLKKDDAQSYRDASKPYRKRNKLLAEGRRDPSLSMFLDALSSLADRS